MSPLGPDSRWEDADGFYAALVDLLDGCDEAAANRILSRLVLILANQVGDRQTLQAALALAAAEEGDAQP
jgi:hypothetical protein